MKKNIQFILLSIIVTTSLTTISAQGQRITENHVKAAFMKNICQFVTWPDTVNLNNDFKILIHGYSAINPVIESFFKTIKVKDKTVSVSVIQSSNKMIECDILFINKTSDKELLKILDNAKDYNALIVSDTKGYAEKGTHINFYLDNQQVKFEINLNKTKNDGFYIQSLLLDYARIIENKNEKY